MNSNIIFKEVQYLKLYNIVLLGTYFFLLWCFLTTVDLHAAAWITGTTLFFLLLLMLFYRMKTIVTSRSLTIIFGIGIIKFNWELACLEPAETIKVPWYYGIGIRILPKGLLYNAAPGKAVKVINRCKSSSFYIGTSRNHPLAEALTAKK